MMSVDPALAQSASCADASAVIDWWIGNPPYSAEWLERRQGLWFRADDEVDGQIRTRFAALVGRAAQGQLDGWAVQPVDWLALLILLDQFPRNLWRDDARAFGSDAKARELAGQGIRRGFDQELPPAVRLFCYLPLEHAEDLAAQRWSVDLFERLQQEAPEELADGFAIWADYARRHAEVIARFGRFPHRNAVLGRDITPAEEAWLSRHPQGF